MAFGKADFQSFGTMEMPPVSIETHIEFINPQQIVIDVFGRNSLMYKIAQCESNFDTHAIGDGHLICKQTGEPIRSRGIWQINNCAYPEITDEQAFDPVWSTQWAKEQFEKGLAEKEWKNCYNLNK